MKTKNNNDMFYDRNSERRVLEQLRQRQAITMKELVGATGDGTETVQACLAALVRQGQVDILCPLRRTTGKGCEAPCFYRLRRETDCEFQWEVPLFNESRKLSTWGSAGPGALWEIRCLERYA